MSASSVAKAAGRHDGRRRYVHADDPPLSAEDNRLLATYPRPMTRAECEPGGLNAARPCPYASCRFHLVLDVTPVGRIVFHSPVEVSEMAETCALDVAEDGGLTLDAVGLFFGISRERIRQIEVEALAKMRAELVARGAE